MADIINPLATLVASFAGAWVAFKLHAANKSREGEKANIAAANRVLLTMMQQVNQLTVYQTDHIEPQRNHPGRHLAIQATLPFDLGTLNYDLGSLDFLSSVEERQLLFDLSVEERRFTEALKAINARSNMVLNEVHPKLLVAGFDDSAEYGGNEFKAAIGQPMYNKLKRLTDDVIYHVDRTIDSINTTKNKFRAALLKRYPKGKFLNFTFQEPAR